MKKYDKIFTDNPFIDELVYFTKILAVNAVIKDSDKANENESIESLKAGDLYIACRENRVRFEQFNYDLEFLIESSILPPAIIEDCAKDNDRIPLTYRNDLLNLRKIKYIEEYNETNNYYRKYMGLPPMEDTNKDFVYLNEDYLADIPQLNNPELPVHMMNIQDLTILYSHEVIDDLIEEYPDKPYLKFMGDNAIDIYKARKAMEFQILYIPTVSNRELMDRWTTKYEQNRMYTLKTYYSDAYKLYSDYYNNFIIVFIILQTMIDIISEVQEFIARRDIFDDRSIRYLFESYGIPYYPEIPRKYQLAMVKNINTLLKWKASTKNMIDICSLFGFDDIDIFRYYLLRDRRVEIDGDNDNKNDDYQFHYKTIIDENGEEKIVPDNDKNYELKFVRVPIDEKADDYLKDKIAYEDYDIITGQDEFWDGKSDHNDIKSAILDQEFSWTRTKYISIDTLYDISEMSFDLPYFINMLVDDTLLEDYLYVKIPSIKNNHQFRVNDLFVYMMALTYVYHGFEDLIMDSRSKILSILGFNFHVDMNEVAEDIYTKSLKTLEELDLDGFDIPNSEIVSFDELLEIFTTNKNIWKIACEGMVHADNKRMYDCYKKLYESCYIEEYTTTFFKLQDGTTAKTYTEFLKERDYVLFESLQDLRSYTNEDSLRKSIANIIIDIVYVLDEYMDSDNFKYVFSRFPAVSGDYVRTYMLKIVNFFKSYKVHLLDISTVYKAFDKRENSIKVYEDWLMSVKKTTDDYSQIIEEITNDINISKTDKINLLEQVYFDIERWEFKELNDRFVFDFKQQISELIHELILDDKIVITDDGKEFPFDGIEYTYEKDDNSYIIDSIDPEINKNIKEKYSILDQIKIITTSETPMDELITTLITGKEFRVALDNINPNASSIVFTDTIIPEDKVDIATVVSTDNSKYNAYMYSDGDTVFVSPDTAEVVIDANNDCAFMFGSTKLSAFDFTNFNTAKVSVMGSMFSDCIELQTLDLSKFNTYAVSNMALMFNGCTNLTSLDVSKFNTNGVFNMYGMFYNCNSLQQLDISNFNTSNVTDMGNMFGNCAQLQELNLSNFNTSKVTDMLFMFNNCSSLTTLDLSNFDTSKVTDMASMFQNCTSLNTLDISNFDTPNVEDMNGMFNNCSSLAALDLSNFDTSKVTDMACMFDGCINLDTLNLSNINTSKVTDMHHMFNECKLLNTIDVSNFDTCNVINMSNMFSKCCGLTTLDLSNFDTCEVTDMSNMFNCCDCLVSEITIMNPLMENYSDVFGRCSTMNGDFLVRYNKGCRDIAKGMVNTKSDNSNVYLAVAELISGREINNLLLELDPDKLITSILFTYDALSEDKVANAINVSTPNSLYDIYLYIEGTTVYIAPERDDIIIRANVNSDFMFSKYTSLTLIDFTNFDTVNIQNMNSMFSECKALQNIDVSNFNTTNVTDMGNMFYGCNKVTTIDVSMFDTSKVIDMTGMFSGCKTIRVLDVSNFNTSNVTLMPMMFFQCSMVSKIDVSGFDTSKVTDMASMFNGCARVTTLDLSSFDTRSCCDMQYMFNSCLKLSALDLSNFNTTNVNNMTAMFKNCKKLQTLDVSSFNTDKVTEMSCMFFHCELVEELDVSKFNGSKVIFYWDNMMFSDCYALRSLDLSNFDTSSAISMKDMFKECRSLTTLNIPKLNTTNVTTMFNMFYNCSSLTSLDVSNFDTSKVTTMSGMFWNCSRLTSLDVSNFDTTKINDIREMFKNCSGLTSLDVSNFDTTNVNNMIDLFYNCSGLTSLDLSNFDTSKVTSLWRMFFNCSSLASLNISNFDTSKVTSVAETFSNCKVLNSDIIISNPNITEYSFTFFDCSIENNSQFTINYTPECEDIVQKLLLTKSENSNVVAIPIA